MKLPHLTRPAGPWLHLFVATHAEACNAVWGLEQSAPLRLAARVVRGRKATTTAAFFDEASAALQFPYYFGENWDAVHDCLADLSWLRAEAVVVFFADAVHLLEKAAAGEVPRFLTVLNETVRDWNQPDPPQAPRPFHVVFHATPEAEAGLTRRWQALGLSLHRPAH
jgi:RNAse (barnase) inhibitor barstar